MQENINRNPFSIYLLRHFIESEARIVFGEKGIEFVVKYLSTPKTLNQKTKEDIIEASKFVTQEQEDAARSVISWVIKHRSLLKYAEWMLDKVAQRLTFYGHFSSWEEFEMSYSRWTTKYNVFKGTKDSRKLIEIHDDVYDLYSEENTFLRQSGRLEGNEHKNIIRLNGKHIIRLAKEEEEIESEDLKFSSFERPPSLDISICSSQGFNSPFTYYVINPHLRVVGDIYCLIAEVIRFTQNTEFVILDFKENVFGEKPSMVVMNMRAINYGIYKTISFRLADIVLKQIKALKFPEEYNIDTMQISVVADKKVFNPVSKMLGFTEIKPSIFALSPKQYVKGETHFYKYFRGATIKYPKGVKRYGNALINLYNSSDNEVRVLDLY